VLTDDEISKMTPDQRRQVIARLVDVERIPELTKGTPRYRAVFLRVVLVATLVLIPWIVFLGARLPRQYAADNWDLVWAIFDVVLLIALGLTAWGVWKRRQLVIVTSIISGTLLMCDAWFDIMTSHPGYDQLVSVASALLGELPLALLMFYTAYRLLRMTARAVNILLGGNGEIDHLWRQPILMLQVRKLLEAAPTTENR
jgi:hypothetical protein